MKKLLVFVLLLVVAAWGTASWYVGKRVETEYLDFIEQKGRYGPIALTSRGYDRGFLTSQAVTELSLSVPMADNPGAPVRMEELRVYLEQTIYHGPLLLGAPMGAGSFGLALFETDISFPDDGRGDFETMVEEVPELRQSYAWGKINYRGNVNGRARVPSFTFEEGGTVMSFDGFNAEVDYNPGSGRLVGRADMGHFQGSAEDVSMEIRGFDGSFDLLEVLPNLFVGTNQAEFGGLDLKITLAKNNREEMVEIGPVRVDSGSQFVDGLVSGSQIATFGGVSVNGVTYGPLEFEMEMANIDGQAISDTQEKLLSFYRRHSFDDSQKMVELLAPIYAEMFADMLDDNPQFRINRLYVNTPMGEAEGSFLLDYDHPQRQAPEDIRNVREFLPFFTADLKLDVDQGLARALLKSSARKELAKTGGRSRVEPMSKLEREAAANQQAERQLQIFAGQKYIIRAGKSITSHLTLNNGLLEVNGKPLPLFGTN